MRLNKTYKTMKRLANQSETDKDKVDSLSLCRTNKAVSEIPISYRNTTLQASHSSQHSTHTTIMNTGGDDETTSTYLDRGVESANGFLTKMFSSCSEDPKGSVHRAWGISLIFVVVFFIVSVIESE
jgi:hypothetical protein